MRSRFLDVSMLEPPEPMKVVLAALEELADDEYVVMRHRQQPFPLYSILAERGFDRHTRLARDSVGSGPRNVRIEVVIWRAAGPRPDEVPPPEKP